MWPNLILSKILFPWEYFLFVFLFSVFLISSRLQSIVDMADAWWVPWERIGVWGRRRVTGVTWRREWGKKERRKECKQATTEVMVNSWGRHHLYIKTTENTMSVTYLKISFQWMAGDDSYMKIQSCYICHWRSLDDTDGFCFVSSFSPSYISICMQICFKKLTEILFSIGWK